MCLCVCTCVRSSDQGAEPQGGRKAADSTPWTLGCSPQNGVVQPGLPVGAVLSYYAIFQELLDPAFRFSSYVLPGGDFGLAQGSTPGPASPAPTLSGDQQPVDTSEPCSWTLWPAHLENPLCRSNLSCWLLSYFQI